MFFILSKILLFIISPAFWICVLLIWSFVTKKERRKKALRIASLAMFIIFTNPVLFNVSVNAWQPGPVEIPAGKRYSAAIVLGGVIMTDGKKRMYFGPESDRFIQTTKLYRTGTVQYVMATGGSGSLTERDAKEANQFRRQFLLQGIPDSAIIIENASRNTYENAVFSKRILDSLRIPAPYIVITSAIHVPRAKAVFKKAGLDVIFYPAAYKQVNYNKSWSDFIIPDTGILPQWNYLLKEIAGSLIYRLTGKA